MYTVQYAIGVGAQSTLGGTTFFARKICRLLKINKLPEFYTIIARKKISKYPNFL